MLNEAPEIGLAVFPVLRFPGSCYLYEPKMIAE